MKHSDFAIYRIVCIILLVIQSASTQSCTLNIFSKSCTCTSDQSRLGLKCNYTSNTAIERLLPGNQSLLTLHTVDLSSNNLSSLPQDYFSGISVISTIDLRINNFREIPSVIFTLNNISRLDISNNNLQHFTLSVLSDISENGTLVVSGNNIEELLEPVYSITAGKYLYLTDISHNAISVINDTSSLWNSCIKLDISHNKLEQFRPKLVSHIQILDLSFNSLKELYAESFSRFVNLKHLTLSHNQIYKISETTFYHPTGLIFLDLSHNELASLHTDSFSNALRLEVLDISNNLLQSLESELFRGLEYSLTELKVSDNNLSTIEINSFLNLHDLRVLILSNNIDLKKVNFDLPPHLKQIDLKNNSLQEINECKFVQLLDIEVLNVENNALKCSCNLSWLYSKYENLRKLNSPTSENVSPMSPWKCNDSDGNSQSISDFDSVDCLDHNSTPEHCATTVSIKSVENRNFSINVAKYDNIVVKWILDDSTDIYGFIVIVKNIDSGDMLTSPMIQSNVREYTIYQSSENSVIICVQVMGNSTVILMEECDKIVTFDMKMIIGIVAGAIFLVPAILIFAYIACKDKKAMAKVYYQLLQASNAEQNGYKIAEKIEIAEEPETKSLSKGRQSTGASATTASVKETDYVVHAKPSVIFENKSYMPDSGVDESNNIERKNGIVFEKNDATFHIETDHSGQYSSKL
ncbi:hypothetical protein CHS0354_042808 [Potamilus streckersoni]|uniref:Uncharacterized protein n=1 Tax=Potamilus streckersoni TaxID=2493646 RepID=A0AAE0T4S1_9BIVA|nr:hypothetical protein CHS0354_042808 [Potamilus streckersoni]